MPLKIIRQDITKIECDAIVNPTNRRILPGGGTDAAIHSAAGAELSEHCRGIGEISVGEAVITPAFKLPSKYVIHTVGPEWRGGLDGERVLLRSCYARSMSLAIENGCESIAFPLISSGAYGYPKERVLKEATDVITGFLENYEIDVYIVVYDKDSYSISKEIYSDVQTFIDIFCLDEGFETSASFPNKRRRGLFSRDKKCRIEENACIIGDLPDEADLTRCLTVSMCQAASLDSMLRAMDKGFAETLFQYIDKKGITDVQAYKRSNVGKKTFSKIKCNKNYRPSKETAVSFAIGLHLDIDETNHLLSTAGMCLSRASKFDVIIEYFILTGKYETIFDVNEVLYQFDQPLLGV